MSFFSKDLVEKLQTEIGQIISSELRLSAKTSVLVGISGGPDSVALLHLLASCSFPLDLHAIYIDHCLRPAETPKEVELVSELCRKLTIPLIVEKVNVPVFKAQHGYSPEEAARILRYRAFTDHLHNVNAKHVAVAHNADDQVEEFFLRLARGTGLTGLSGMKYKSGEVIRPLLKYHKHHLLAYLEALNIPYCLDSSNASRKYLRNRMRLDFLPELEKSFPNGIRSRITQTMEILRTDDAFICDTVTQKMHDCVRHLDKENPIFPATNGYLLDLGKFLGCHPAIQRRILEQCCVLINTQPSYKLIVELLTHIKKGHLPGECHLPRGGRLLSHSEGLLFCRPLTDTLRGKVPDAPVIFRTIDGPGSIEIEEANRKLTLTEGEVSQNNQFSGRTDFLQVDLEKITFPLTLRSYRPGDRLTVVNSSGSKKIGRYLNDKKIPARQKNLWPVLETSPPDRMIIAIAGMTIEDSYKVTKHTRKILTIRWEPISGE